MGKYLWTAIVFLATALGASAHFVFFVPDAATGDVKAIFSDSLKPDDHVSIEKIDNTKLVVLDASGKQAAAKWTVDAKGGFYKIQVSGTGTRIVAGATDYGILQRGDSKPFWLKYYAKTILGSMPAADKATLGEWAPVEIVPVVDDGKIRFQALVAGKPAVKTAISVLAPGEEKFQDLTTDEKGFTSTFSKAGQYGARLRSVEMKSGEDKGKKYEELRSYATLVVDFAPPSK